MGRLTDDFNALYNSCVDQTASDDPHVHRLLEYFFFSGAGKIIDHINMAKGDPALFNELLRETFRALYEKYKDGVPD